MKIKKDDTILIISGKDKGKKGKVLKVFPKKNKIVVEGINLIKKHQKPKRTGEKGQTLEIPAPFDVSRAELICSQCKKATRIGYSEQDAQYTGRRTARYELTEKGKNRICKKCGQVISRLRQGFRLRPSGFGLRPTKSPSADEVGGQVGGQAKIKSQKSKTQI